MSWEPTSDAGTPAPSQPIMQAMQGFHDRAGQPEITHQPAAERQRRELRGAIRGCQEEYRRLRPEMLRIEIVLGLAGLAIGALGFYAILRQVNSMRERHHDCRSSCRRRR